MRVYPAKFLRGTARLPGDKSISHRAALIGSIADGATVITGFAASADCHSTLGCMRQLGVGIDINGSTVTISGVGPKGLRKPANELDCGNSGTTMRLLSGILAGQEFTSKMIGDESLSGRPMNRIVLPLSQMGAEIETVNGKAPLTIKGKYPLTAIEYETPVASAQIKSCVLLAGLFAEGGTTVIEKTLTRDHTERILGSFGAEIIVAEDAETRRISIAPGGKLTGREFNIPGDISAAAFFIAAAAALPGSEITMKNVGLNPTRTAFLEVVQGLGADIQYSNPDESGGEPLGDITVRDGNTLDSSSSNLISGRIVANLIDEVPILAVLGTQIEGGIEIRGAAELRVKESDRIAAVVENLRRMGADVEEFDDGLKVGRSELKGAEIESYGDHRIAMAFAVAGLFAEGAAIISQPDCVDVSFPGFYEELNSLVKEYAE